MRVALPVGLLVVCGLVVTDLAYDFWTKHALSASLVANAVVLALTLWIVNRVQRERAERRWRPVALVAYRSLGVSARDLLARLAALYTDAEQIEAALGGVWLFDGLTPSRELKDLPAWRAGLDVFKKPDLPPLDTASDEPPPVQRLRFLATDDDWLRTAAVQVHDAREALIVELERWAAVMVGAHQPAARVAMFAQLVDAVASLRERLLRYATNQTRIRWRSTTSSFGGSCSTRRRRLLTNVLWRDGDTPYRFAIRRDVIGCSLEDAFEQRDRLGAWLPSSGS